MRRGWSLVCLLPALLAAAPASLDPVTTLAGRYAHRFRNGAVDGSTYWSDDVAEIVPVDARDAYVNFRLHFYNGHECSLSGIAQADGGSLVYRGLPDDSFANGETCRLVIHRTADALAWDDAGTCKAHCGARGSFLGGSLPWASKRRITYMDRLKASPEYRQALSEWRR